MAIQLGVPINGIIPLTQGINEQNQYVNLQRGVPDVWWGRVIASVFLKLYKREWYTYRVIVYDLNVLGVKEGDIIPWYSLAYWWLRPALWMGKYGKDVPSIQ